MQCAVRRRRCSTLDHIDMEQQQQSLFDVSIVKLQHEQLRHGVEPRLLRFVLINNALRSLQGHMLHIDDDEALIGFSGGPPGDEGGEESGSVSSGGIPCESSDIFFYNTFKNGSLSSIPLSPPTPVKVMKLDNGLTDQSPLVEFQDAVSSPCPSQDILTSSDEVRVHPAAGYYEGTGCEGEETDEGGGGEEGSGGGGNDLKEKRLMNGLTNSVHMPSASLLGKRSRGEWSAHDHDHVVGGTKDSSRCRSLEGEGGGELEASDPKKACKPSNLIINSTIQKVQSGMNGLNGLLVDLEPFPSLPFPSSPPSPSSPSLPSPLPLPPHYHHAHFSSASSEESDKDSLTPSPIDFTNVDPTLYDFDTAALHVDSTGSVPSLDAQETGSLPNPLAAAQPQSNHHVPAVTTSHGSVIMPVTIVSSASSNSTHHLPSHLSASPLQSSVICPSSTTSSSSTSSQVCSSVIVTTAQTQLLQHHRDHHTHQSQRGSASCDNDNDSNHAHGSLEVPHDVEPEKISTLVSADSTVLTAGLGSSPKGSCSMKALVRAGSAEAEGLSQNGGAMGDGNSGGLATSPEHSVEPDFLDEIDHIVELLMT